MSREFPLGDGSDDLFMQPYSNVCENYSVKSKLRMNSIIYKPQGSRTNAFII
jgi:hypothetical protein